MRYARTWFAVVALLVLVGGLAGVGRAASPESLEVGLGSADVLLVGEQVGGWAAYSTSPAGDVNGDGFSDVLIGAPLTSFSQAGTQLAATGKTYLVLGRPRDQWPANPIVLSQADASFNGCPEAGMTGRQVYTAGDVNGDGYDDFLISGWKCYVNRIFQGKTFLFLGKPEADWGQGFPTAQADAIFLGEHKLEYSGYYVATAGDVNGDGFDDFLITCPECDYGSADTGQVYLILGRAAADWGSAFMLGSADASFVGEVSGDRVGRSASGVGDVNGDGLADFVIGSIASDEGATDAGQSYLVLGRVAADWGLRYSLSLADASFVGEAEGDESGRRVAQAGDVNGDGYDDFVIGASRSDQAGTDAGKAYLILGRAAADWGMDSPLGQADASFVGEEAGDQAGRRVTGVGDFNHDGLADLLVGAPHNSRAADAAGAAYLVLGRASVDWGQNHPLENADAVYVGEETLDVAGYDVSAVGDVDGDGRDDLIVGAFGGQETLVEPIAVLNGDPTMLESAGKAYILFSHAAEAPGIPVQVAPMDGSVTNQVEVLFRWRAGTGGLPDGFKVYLDGTTTVVYGTSWQRVLELGVHTWRVRAFNSYGTSAWSLPWTVEVAAVPPKMYVGNIRITQRYIPPRYKLQSLVPIWDQAGQAVSGATVTARWAHPDGSTVVQNAVTAPNGSAFFSRQTTLTGVHVITILDVQKSGFQYDPAMNQETSEEISVP